MLPSFMVRLYIIYGLSDKDLITLFDIIAKPSRGTAHVKAAGYAGFAPAPAVAIAIQIRPYGLAFCLAFRFANRFAYRLANGFTYRLTYRLANGFALGFANRLAHRFAYRLAYGLRAYFFFKTYLCGNADNLFLGRTFADRFVFS